MKSPILFVSILIVASAGVLGSEVVVLGGDNFETSIKEGTWQVQFTFNFY